MNCKVKVYHLIVQKGEIMPRIYPVKKSCKSKWPSPRFEILIYTHAQTSSLSTTFKCNIVLKNINISYICKSNKIHALNSVHDESVLPSWFTNVNWTRNVVRPKALINHQHSTVHYLPCLKKQNKNIYIIINEVLY